MPYAKESRKRSLAKALSWRFAATVITMFVAFFVTREKVAALSIGLVDTLIKLFAYYGHERLWANLRFGTGRQPPEYEI